MTPTMIICTASADRMTPKMRVIAPAIWSPMTRISGPAARKISPASTRFAAMAKDTMLMPTGSAPAFCM